jgi:hypothetical protein
MKCEVNGGLLYNVCKLSCLPRLSTTGSLYHRLISVELFWPSKLNICGGEISSLHCKVQGDWRALYNGGKGIAVYVNMSVL